MNDEQGHRAGDELIVRAAGTIAAIFAEDAYRVGGDEFVVILLDVSREDFARKTEQLRRQMQGKQRGCVHRRGMAGQHREPGGPAAPGR